VQLLNTSIKDIVLSLPASGDSFSAVLELACSESRSQGAYLYWFDRKSTTARLAAWTGLAPSQDGELIESGPIAVAQHVERVTPLVLHEGAGDDPRFRGLPEFQSHPFVGVVSVPLTSSGIAVGMFNVCRLQAAPIHPRELAFLMSLSGPVTVLADHRLIEVAKTLLQDCYRLDEEQAYFFIRNASRRRRTAMREIAWEVIERLVPEGVTA
jgi:hypothetical protein